MRRSPWFALAVLGCLFLLNGNVSSDEPAGEAAPSGENPVVGSEVSSGIDHWGSIELSERPRARKVPAGDEEPVTPEPDPVTAEVLRREEEARLAFRRAKVIEVDETFENVPLREVIENLVGKLDMPFRIEEEALTDFGRPLDQTASFDFRGLTLSEAFEDFVPYDIAFVRSGRRVIVTTSEIAEEQLETRFYPVGDLTITTGKGGKRQYDAEPLMALIEQTTSGPWFSVDGVGGTLSLYDAGGLHLLAVRQTGPVQEEIEDLLHRLRSMRRGTGRSE